jgi:hypothetical protein
LTKKPTVYLETTIVSYLTARPSSDIVIAGHQQITREWWEKRLRFDLVISELVLREAGGGDQEAAARRLTAIREIPVLKLDDEATDLARELVNRGPLPKKALADALHIAICVTRGVGFLLTWNCSHIANAVVRPKVEELCRSRGYVAPTICTPDELMEV